MIKEVDIAHTSLRNMHPSLFKSLVLKSAMLTLAGVIMIIQGEYSTRQEGLVISYIPIELWGLLFTASGLLTGVGIINNLKRYKYARYGLILGAGICGVWGVSYFAGLFTGPEPSPLGTLFFAYMSGTLMVWAGEPAFNPLASALRQKGTNVAGSGKNE